jgi:hypothetical protein
MRDRPELKVEEIIVLSKFEGDPIPENEFERVHIKNGEVVAVEQIENGEVVSSETIKGVEEWH